MHNLPSTITIFEFSNLSSFSNELRKIAEDRVTIKDSDFPMKGEKTELSVFYKPHFSNFTTRYHCRSGSISALRFRSCKILTLFNISSSDLATTAEMDTDEFTLFWEENISYELKRML
jgi:hypothetical protein